VNEAVQVQKLWKRLKLTIIVPTPSRMSGQNHISARYMFLAALLLLVVTGAVAQGDLGNSTLSIPTFNDPTVSYEQPNGTVGTTVTVTQSLPYTALPTNSSVAASNGVSITARPPMRTIRIVGFLYSIVWVGFNVSPYPITELGDIWDDAVFCQVTY